MSHDKQIEILKSKFEKEYKKVFENSFSLHWKLFNTIKAL